MHRTKLNPVNMHRLTPRSFIRFYANRDTQTYVRVYVYVVCYVAFMNALLTSGPNKTLLPVAFKTYTHLELNHREA